MITKKRRTISNNTYDISKGCSTRRFYIGLTMTTISIFIYKKMEFSNNK